MLKNLALFLTSSVLILIFVNYIGNIDPVIHDLSHPVKGVVFKDTNSSLRHVLLRGSPYNRGYEQGRLFSAELEIQENMMMRKLKDFIPSVFMQRLLFFVSKIWFFDLDQYIDDDSLMEMEGISKFSAKKYDNLASPLTRQVAYHGIHEVGQIFVDDDRVDLGCFVSILNTPKGRVIGRNFDFDIDGYFDKNKIIKWSFPDKGNSYVSVIFPGMVGVVTGVNDKGIFVSLNAAGSDSFSRVGTPTTLVLKNVLEKSRSIDEALKTVQDAQVFITEIFIIADIYKNIVYKIEKTPGSFSVVKVVDDTVVANHLVDEEWSQDKTNLKRQKDLTTLSRYNRGKELLDLKNLSPMEKTLRIIRDKNVVNQASVHLGHRASIDSLIASHSTILDFEHNIFYINEGAGTSGKYIGYELSESFIKRKPIFSNSLPASISPSPKKYSYTRKYLIKIKEHLRSIKNRECSQNKSFFEKVKSDSTVHYDKDIFLGEYVFICDNNPDLAMTYFKRAIDNGLPFKKNVDILKQRINKYEK